MLLEITFRKGRPFAGYQHFATEGARTNRARKLARNLIGDFDKRGELLGLELLAFDNATLSRINKVLASNGLAPLAGQELATLRAVCVGKPEPRTSGPEDIDWSTAKVIGRGIKRGRKFDLRALRVALTTTQGDIAEAADMAQGDLSRVKVRQDTKLSTLARHASALGGKLEVAIWIGSRRYLLDL
jgi:hypothetical protein